MTRTRRQPDGKQIRETDSLWTREDAERAMAARMLNVTPEPVAPAVVTFKQMTERYLREKDAAKKKTIKANKNIIVRGSRPSGSATR